MSLDDWCVVGDWSSNGLDDWGVVCEWCMIGDWGSYSLDDWSMSVVEWRTV